MDDTKKRHNSHNTLIDSKNREENPVSRPKSRLNGVLRRGDSLNGVRGIGTSSLPTQASYLQSLDYNSPRLNLLTKDSVREYIIDKSNETAANVVLEEAIDTEESALHIGRPQSPSPATVDDCTVCIPFLNLTDVQGQTAPPTNEARIVGDEALVLDKRLTTPEVVRYDKKDYILFNSLCAV